MIGMPVEDAIEECAGAWLFQQCDFESCGVFPGVFVTGAGGSGSGSGAGEFVSGRGAGGAVSAGAGEQQGEQAGCAEADDRHGAGCCVQQCGWRGQRGNGFEGILGNHRLSGKQKPAVVRGFAGNSREQWCVVRGGVDRRFLPGVDGGG